MINCDSKRLKHITTITRMENFYTLQGNHRNGATLPPTAFSESKVFRIGFCVELLVPTLSFEPILFLIYFPILFSFFTLNIMKHWNV